MNPIKHLMIDTDAPDDYMVEILCQVRHRIKHGKYTGKGSVNRVDRVLYYYSYTYSV